MAKFVIECPDCTRHLEVNTKGSKIIAFFKGDNFQNTCSCGYKYTDAGKFITIKCPDCGIDMFYNQEKGQKPKCFSCGSDKVRTLGSPTRRFPCPECGCGISVDKGEPTCVCPVCGKEDIDVKKELELVNIAKSGLASVIKYEGDNNTFVWKHPVEDFNIGSMLIVHESQEAIFFRNGQALDLFPAGRYALETESIPLINKLYNSVLDPKDVFHSEVYFINMTTQMGIKWGTDSKVRFLEPITGIPLDIGASGEFNLRVSDSRKLLVKLVGTDSVLKRDTLLKTNFDSEDQSSFKSVFGYFRTLIMTRVKTHLAKTIKENQINILEVDEQLDALSQALRNILNEGLAEYGLTMPEFFVNTIVTPDDDANFKKLKQQHADRYIKVQDEINLKLIREAEAERLKIDQHQKIIKAQGDAEVVKTAAHAEAEAYRMQAEAEAMEMKMKGYTYAQETQRQVGLEAMKGGIIKEGSGGGSGMGDLVGLGVGLGAIGSVVNIAKDAIAPITSSSTGIGAAVTGMVGGGGIPAVDNTISADGKDAVATWDCSCGEKAVKGNFCSSCGAKKTEGWACSKCTTSNDKGNFCSNCGEKKPLNTTWDCACGEKSITGKFCSNCGKNREG